MKMRDVNRTLFLLLLQGPICRSDNLILITAPHGKQLVPQ